MLKCTLYFKSCEWRILKSNPSFLTVKNCQISALHPFTQYCSAYTICMPQEGNLRNESLNRSIGVFVHMVWYSSLPSCGSDEAFWTNAPWASKAFIWLSGYSSSGGKPTWEPKPRTWRQELKLRPEKNSANWLVPIGSYSTSILIQPKPICPELLPLTLGCLLLNQLTI